MRLSSRVVVTSLVVLGSCPALAWQTAVTGTPPAGRASAVGIDSAGDVLTVGRAADAGGGENALAAKLDGTTGEEEWRLETAGAAGGNDLFRGLAIVGTDLFATGQVLEGPPTEGDALVMRIAANGTPAWSVKFDGGAGLEDDGFAIGVDGAGDVYVAMQSTPTGQTSTRFTVVKRQGSDGGPVWTSVFTGGGGTARAVVVQGTDVFVAGEVAGIMVVAKLDPATGTPLWRTDIADVVGEPDIGRALAVGGGRVVVAGRMALAVDDPTFGVVALDAATGVESWRRMIDGTVTGGADNDEAFGVAVDAAGDVIAAGTISDTATDDDLVAVKLEAATGIETWRTVVNGGNDNDDVANALALDAAGDVFVAGTIRHPVTRADFLVMKLANATGAELWRSEVNGGEDAADSALAIAVADGDVVAAGRVREGAADGYAVVKRTGANGGDFPCANDEDDAGEECDDGNVVPGDGCRGDCTVEACGDAIPDPQEECDDGNVVDGDCCSSTCAADADGTPCDDDDACTLEDACAAGACAATSTVDCTPDDPCQTGTCSPVDGSCTTAPKAEGAPCDDANVCTVLDRCIASVCDGAFTVTCNDADPCTTDGCDAVAGCVATPVEGFASVICTFERTAIATACTLGVPRFIQRRLDRALALVIRASEAAKPKRAIAFLRQAEKALGQAGRKTASLARRGKLDTTCAAELSGEITDMRERNDYLRATLRS